MGGGGLWENETLTTIEKAGPRGGQSSIRQSIWPRRGKNLNTQVFNRRREGSTLDWTLTSSEESPDAREGAHSARVAGMVKETNGPGRIKRK